MDIEKLFSEIIEFPEGSDCRYVTTASAKIFAQRCVDKLESEIAPGDIDEADKIIK